MKKKLFPKKSMVRTLVIIGVIVIPLMYSLFYLGAFWDPYSRLETLPVAVVNNDSGATINNATRNLGQEISSKLVENASLNFIVTDLEDAQEGTAGDEYYAMIVFPEDFSANIASAATSQKKTATIEYSPNEKKNYLASQILSKAVLQLENSTQESITQEIVTSLTNQVADLPAQMTTLEDGLDQLASGSSTLASGSQELASGTEQFNQSFIEYSQGIAALGDGATQLDERASQVAQGASDLSAGLETYTAGVESLIANVNDTATFITAYVQANPQLLQDPTFMAFIQQLSNPDNAANIQALLNAGDQLNTGAASLATGSQSLSVGAASLNDGTATIEAATDELAAATTKINEGASDLSEGMTKLDDGLDLATQEVTSAMEETNSQLAALDGLGEYAASPVQIETQTINPIANYGTYFAPYFMSLSLWVGALMIFFGIYFDGDGRFAILSRNSEHKLARSLIYLALGLAQAVVLGLVLIYGLGLEVAHPLVFFGTLSLVSMVSIAIVQFCIVHLGNLGKFGAITLLILQLTSCGGTFPMETVPKFFNVLYPYMPMTYAVALFKDCISGTLTSTTSQNALILGGILMAFFLATVGLSLAKSRRNQNLTVELEA